MRPWSSLTVGMAMVMLYRATTGGLEMPLMMIMITDDLWIARGIKNRGSRLTSPTYYIPQLTPLLLTYKSIYINLPYTMCCNKNRRVQPRYAEARMMPRLISSSINSDKGITPYRSSPQPASRTESSLKAPPPAYSPTDEASRHADLILSPVEPVSPISISSMGSAGSNFSPEETVCFELGHKVSTHQTNVKMSS